MNGDLRTRVEALTARIKREAQLLGGCHPIDKGARRNIGIDADRLAALVLDADPDTPTADVPADTDLVEQIAATLYDTEARRLGYDLTWKDCVADPNRWLDAADALLPLVRAQVEAARRDALNEAADALAPVKFGRKAQRWLRDRSARGETRQP